MKLSDFDYALPENLIALEPAQERTAARLLYVPRGEGTVAHYTFHDLIRFLNPGDVLVLNNTKVLPARLLGKRHTGGQVEALLIQSRGGGRWEALVRPSGRVKKGDVLEFGENGIRLQAQVCDGPRQDTGVRLLRFEDAAFKEKLEKIGHMPLPPYINRPDTDRDVCDYQTIFASEPGAVAAPTAGLHFDETLLEALRQKGIETVFITLHVGYGTFQPISAEDVAQHQMFEEDYEISKKAADQINQAVAEGRRLVACGTTSVRTLESAVQENGQVAAGRGKTRLFVYPSYHFKIVKGLITNFHLPKSTLLLLVAAFLNRSERLLEIYRMAVNAGYRFYSYGDAMVIL